MMPRAWACACYATFQVCVCWRRLMISRAWACACCTAFSSMCLLEKIFCGNMRHVYIVIHGAMGWQCMFYSFICKKRSHKTCKMWFASTWNAIISDINWAKATWRDFHHLHGGMSDGTSTVSYLPSSSTICSCNFFSAASASLSLCRSVTFWTTILGRIHFGQLSWSLPRLRAHWKSGRNLQASGRFLSLAFLLQEIYHSLLVRIGSAAMMAPSWLALEAIKKSAATAAQLNCGFSDKRPHEMVRENILHQGPSQNHNRTTQVLASLGRSLVLFEIQGPSQNWEVLGSVLSFFVIPHLSGEGC